MWHHLQQNLYLQDANLPTLPCVEGLVFRAWGLGSANAPAAGIAVKMLTGVTPSAVDPVLARRQLPI